MVIGGGQVVDGEEDDHGHRWRVSSGWGRGRPWS